MGFLAPTGETFILQHCSLGRAVPWLLSRSLPEGDGFQRMTAFKGSLKDS